MVYTCGRVVQKYIVSEIQKMLVPGLGSQNPLLSQGLCTDRISVRQETRRAKSWEQTLRKDARAIRSEQSHDRRTWS